ncbi:hypothetical protein G647_07792 [Cladophialophora carrionii CBS 160.54]|uniref:Uncharacterized protein n=1 Tax=Cladophialophora carrionii CBS 160.54 TaxID=1279043 RepID=V9D3K9_9EURO|nr:uncharacterized protein G647_07792 [Cladophialophora carrionii CBS 160.54]ETI21445.1 hypothetical protein G647_07792 [Cladophialophora carrionii CBS 160.54]
MDLAGPVPELKSHTGSTSKPDDAYLSDFTRLGEQIYYYAPTSTSRSTPTTSSTTDVVATAVKQSTPDPDLIIICSWMYALPRHIAKYTQAYRAKYASSPILLLRQDGGDFFWRTHATQMRNLEPAASVIRTLQRRSHSVDTTQVDQNANPRPEAKAKAKAKLRVLMHVFSNGGAWSACQLADAYASAFSFTCPSISTLSPRESDHANAILPIDALILDSTPSLPDPRASHAAICEALPSPTTYPLTRKVGETAVWCFLALASGVDALFGREHLTLNIRRRLNDPAGAFMQPGLRRVYIYSETDALIPASDVELHAEEARARARARVMAREKAENKGGLETSTDISTPITGDDESNGSGSGNGNNNGNSISDKGDGTSTGTGDSITTSDDGTGPGADANTRIWLEKFEHTRHVGHMQGDPGRYWAVVERAWRGGRREDQDQNKGEDTTDSRQ